MNSEGIFNFEFVLEKKVLKLVNADLNGTLIDKNDMCENPKSQFSAAEIN